MSVLLYSKIKWQKFLNSMESNLYCCTPAHVFIGIFFKNCVIISNSNGMILATENYIKCGSKFKHGKLILCTR